MIIILADHIIFISKNQIEQLSRRRFSFSASPINSSTLTSLLLLPPSSQPIFELRAQHNHRQLSQRSNSSKNPKEKGQIDISHNSSSPLLQSQSQQYTKRVHSSLQGHQQQKQQQYQTIGAALLLLAADRLHLTCTAATAKIVGIVSSRLWCGSYTGKNGPIHGLLSGAYGLLSERGGA